MGRSTILLMIALLAVGIAVVTLTGPATAPQEHGYLGTIRNVTSFTDSHGENVYQLEVIGSNDLPVNDRGPWCVDIEAKDFKKAHAGQSVEFVFLNPIHTAIAIVNFHPSKETP